MADRFYPGHSDKVAPQAFGAGRQNDEQGAGAASVVLTSDIEGYRTESQIDVPDERANWLVAEGFAAYADDYATAHPDYVAKRIKQDGTVEDITPEPDPEPVE